MAAYISGYNNTMDVAGFGFNTQSAMFYQKMHSQLDVHQGVQCSGCSVSPLQGIRWKCQQCPQHDVCNECYKAGMTYGHNFQIASMTTTNNENAMATGGQLQPEGGVHWTTCQGCQQYPIRGTLYACTVCPDCEICSDCNNARIASGQHQHYFDFFYMPRNDQEPQINDAQQTWDEQNQYQQEVEPVYEEEQYGCEQESYNEYGYEEQPVEEYYEEPVEDYSWGY